MITEKQKRNLLLKRVFNISSDKLNDLENYLSKLEKEPVVINKTLAFAGAWEELDDEIFEGFTRNLIPNRLKNNRRFNE